MAGFLSKEQQKDIRKQEEQVKRIWSSSEKFLDQVITTLSVGLLSFTIAFSEKFESVGSHKEYLSLFWLSLFVSVISVVVSNLVSIFACPQEIERLDNVKKGLLDFDELQKDSPLTIVVRAFNNLSTVTFVVALISLALFTLIE